MNRDLIRDLIKYSPSLIIPAIVGIVSLPVLTRLFPPEDYGFYVLVLATVTVLSTIAGWLQMAVIRFYPAYERDGQTDTLIITVLAWLLITATGLSLLYGCVLLITKGAMKTRLSSLLLIGVLVFALSAVSDPLKDILRAKRSAGLYSLFHVWRSVASFSIGILLVLVFDFGIEGILWGTIIAMVLALPPLWKMAIGRLPKVNAFSSELSKEMARYSFPLVVGNLAAWILSLSDRYMLEFLRNSQEVGVYSASYGIAEKSVYIIIALFLLAAGPISIHIWEKEGEQYSREFVTSLTRYYLMACIPLVMGMSVLAKPITDVLIGAEYREGFRVIPLVMAGALFLGLQQRFQAGLIFYKKTGFVMVAILIAGLVNIGLNFVLIPRYGYMAAAVTTLIGYSVLLVIMIVVSRRYFVWSFPFKSLGRVCLSSAIIAAAVYPLGNSLPLPPTIRLVIGAIVGVFLYPAMLFILGEITTNEKKALRYYIARYLPDRLTPTSWKKSS